MHKFEMFGGWGWGTLKIWSRLGARWLWDWIENNEDLKHALKNHNEYWLGGIFLMQRLTLNGKTQEDYVTKYYVYWCDLMHIIKNGTWRSSLFLHHQRPNKWFPKASLHYLNHINVMHSSK
jgi:hypothetical protein